jgi:hypothetical protein
MSGRKTFALLSIGIVVAMAGTASWLAVADDDFKFAIKTTDDQPPRKLVSIEPYDSLSDRQQRIFDRAKAGETVRFEARFPMPRVVEQNGTYYVSKAPRYYDWTDPRTFGPALLFLIGGGIAVQAVRMDIGR